MGNNNTSQLVGIVDEVIMPGDPNGELSKLKTKEHELYDANVERVNNLATASVGYIGGSIINALNKPNIQKVNEMIDKDPFRAYQFLEDIGVTDTHNWRDVINGTTIPKDILDNPLLNTMGNIGGTVKNTVDIAQNITGFVKDTANDVKNLTDPANLKYILIGGAVLVGLFLLKK